MLKHIISKYKYIAWATVSPPTTQSVAVAQGPAYTGVKSWEKLDNMCILFT